MELRIILFVGRARRVRLTIAELCNGSTHDSDSCCLGSNPSSAASTSLHGQAVKTSPSHGENWGSSPHGGTNIVHASHGRFFLFPPTRACAAGGLPARRHSDAIHSVQRHAFFRESCSFSSTRSCATRRAYFSAKDGAEAAAAGGSSWRMICSPSSRKRNSLFRANSLIW